MSENYENNKSPCNLDQDRQFSQWELERERAVALGHIFGNVARNPEHKAWEKQQEDLRTRGEEPSSSFPASSAQNSRGIQYKSAQIHDPTNNQMNEVEVVEDTACRINFISPRVAKLCNLTLLWTEPIHIATLMGKFTSNQRTEVNWFGQNSNHGRNWFYIAPEGAPIDVLVGTEFLNDHHNAFKNRALLEPALLNVQIQLKEAEKSQIQADEEYANRQAAELDKKKRLAKQQKPRQKGKQVASSSRSSRHKKEII